MVQLPTLTMRAEREQLAQLMSQPFAWRPDYQQTKQSFDLFVQDLQTSKVMECLVAMQYGSVHLPVGVGGKCHHQFPRFGGWNCADAGPNHLSVHFDFAGATAAP